MNKFLNAIHSDNRPVRIVKRDKQNPMFVFAMYALAIGLSLCIGAIMLATLKVDVGLFFEKMFTLGMIGNKFAYKSIENFIKVFTPLLITSIGLSLAFKMKFWNIGGEGQFIIGAITASAIALGFDPSVPPVVMMLLMAL
ncbi:MAG: hypothetical protein RR405_06280, partial [Clostridia bacterium]